MNVAESIIEQKELCKIATSLRKGKAHDYAKDSDCLSNFKVMADIEKALEKHGLGIPINTPEGVAMWHVIHKLIRELNLWKKKTVAKNETLKDTVIDEINYVILKHQCYNDV